MYSLTMWKDILFGGVVLLFAIPLEAFKSIPQRRVHLACAAHVYHHRGFDEPFAYKRFFGLCAVHPVCRGDAA